MRTASAQPTETGRSLTCCSRAVKCSGKPRGTMLQQVTRVAVALPPKVLEWPGHASTQSGSLRQMYPRAYPSVPLSIQNPRAKANDSWMDAPADKQHLALRMWCHTARLRCFENTVFTLERLEAMNM